MDLERPQDPTPSTVPDSTPDASPIMEPAAPFVPASSIPALPIISTPSLAPATSSPPVYRDRRSWIIFFGVVQILLGVLTALLVPLILLSAVFSHRTIGGPIHFGQQALIAIIYGSAAVAFIALGIGNIRIRRWGYALTLIASWYGFLVGVFITVLCTAILPVTMRTSLRAQPSQGPQVDSMTMGFMVVFLTIAIVVMAFFLVVLPLAFVIFFSRKDVALTFRDHDPLESWTDRVPSPVLGASIVFAVGAIYSLLTGVLTPIFPFFGHYVTGIAGGLGLFAVSILDVYIAVAFFRRSIAGWWIAVITMFARFVSIVLTYGRGNILEAYSKLGWSNLQLKTMDSNPVFHSHVVLWWGTISVLALFGYLVWLKRYFKTPETTPQVEPVLSTQLG